MRDYGTMKAIGASNAYITGVILSQASILCCAGFAGAVVLIEAFRIGIGATGTIFRFPWWLWVALFLVTALISLGGALFAVRRVAKLEPASVFRG
jgi:putative ABC transport system permease protein